MTLQCLHPISGLSRPVLASAIAGILARDLRTLCREVEAYPDERQLRQEVPGIPNSAGTLVLHLRAMYSTT